jgi:uncharacterized protein (TIGR04141 family)
MEGGQRSFGAVLFQAVSGELVAWSFGNAWQLLDPSRTVERFGLRAGLNALLSSPVPVPQPKRPREVGVRGLTSAIRAAVVRRSTVTTARPSSPAQMERIDQASDAAAMAELTTHHSTFDRISAGRSLRFEADVDHLSDLDTYATEAIRLFRRDDYTRSDDYKWIDYTVPVTDDDEVNQVLDALYSGATSTPPLVIDAVWADADPVTGETASFVCLPNERASPLGSKRTEFPWTAIHQWLIARRPGDPGRQALRTVARFYADDLTEISRSEVWKLLVAQVSIGSDSYFVSDGDVWRTSQAHIDDIDNLIAPHVAINPPYLPAYIAGETEPAFNIRASAHGPHFLLDKSLVQIAGQTPFEPCDLLTSDGLFLHVKRKTSSATMSHVLNQALSSTQLLRGVQEARDALDAVLSTGPLSSRALTKMRDHCASFAGRATGKVVIVIIGSWRGNPDVRQLPLLTRIGLSNWLKQMPCDREIALVGTTTPPPRARGSAASR